MCAGFHAHQWVKLLGVALQTVGIVPANDWILVPHCAGGTVGGKWTCDFFTGADHGQVFVGDPRRSRLPQGRADQPCDLVVARLKRRHPLIIELPPCEVGDGKSSLVSRRGLPRLSVPSALCCSDNHSSIFGSCS